MNQSNKGEAGTLHGLPNMQPVSHQFFSSSSYHKRMGKDKRVSERRKTHANKIEIKPKYRS